MSDSLDALQRHYLETMGIQVWERRAPDEGSGFRVQASRGGEAEPRPAESAPAALASAQQIEVLSGDIRKVEQAPADPEPSTLNPEPVSSLDWEALEQRVADCTVCAELAANRSHTVFGAGNRNADWLIIGEAPGADEEREGQPFVGRAGQLLSAMLYAIGLAREQVYISNILKCHPPQDREPKAEEAAACSAFLQRQIALLKPRVILVLGRVAAQQLLHSEASLDSLRGQVHRHESGVPLVVSHPPAHLLRTPQDKRKAWADRCLARRLLDESRGSDA